MALSMPSASTSTLSMPMASRSSFSHWMTERSFIDAFSTGTSRVSLRLRQHEAADVLAQVARKALELLRELEPLAQP